MESGLLLVVRALLKRLHASLGHPSIEELLNYVLNNSQSWEFPDLADEDESQRTRALRDWHQHLAILDTAILSLCGDTESNAADIADILDDILSSSLWARRINRRQAQVQALFDRALRARAQVIWSMTSAAQRRGYFLAGIGLSSGTQLDVVSHEANLLLMEANGAIQDNRHDDAVSRIVALAAMLFCIPPFTPSNLPAEWRYFLDLWLRGADISQCASENRRNDLLRFIEDGLTYRLPWGMEAVRLRAQANGEGINGIDLDCFELGLAVPAVETGTLNRSAAILIQAGFSSRIGAIKAVEATKATFSNRKELSRWIRSESVTENSMRNDWPTAGTAELWSEFLRASGSAGAATWTPKHAYRKVVWSDGASIFPPGTVVRIHRETEQRTLVLSAEYDVMGYLATPIQREWSGIMQARVAQQKDALFLTYYGTENFF